MTISQKTAYFNTGGFLLELKNNNQRNSLNINKFYCKININNKIKKKEVNKL